MLVVLDTNVMLQARAAGHPHHRILQAWFAGSFDIALSTEILLEYQEVVTARAGAARWHTLGRVLDTSGHVRRISPAFRFRLITADPDDDKFADCAIAAEADFIITEDRHFDVLRGSGHKPQPITPGGVHHPPSGGECGAVKPLREKHRVAPRVKRPTSFDCQSKPRATITFRLTWAGLPGGRMHTPHQLRKPESSVCLLAATSR